MEFREWFCLKDRESFIIDPQINEADARFYFGQEDVKQTIIRQLRFSFVGNMPKMLLIGQYGSGKTQMLFYIRHLLLNFPPSSLKLKPRIVMLAIEMKSRSNHQDLHLQLMEGISKNVVSEWVASIAKKGLNLEEQLRKIFIDENVVQALVKLTIGGINYIAWRWLTGQVLSNKELEQLGVTRNLGQIGAGEMVDEIVGIGKLAELIGEKIIFLIDEAERFLNINTPDAQNALEDYFRNLSEKKNASVGFIIAATASGLDGAARFLATDAVTTRMGKQNIITIKPIPTLDDVKSFITQMLAEIVDQELAEKIIRENNLGVSLASYPFDADSFDLLSEYASQEPTKAIPRNIINAINECGICAWDEQQKIISSEIVQNISRLVFE
ncbi:MAG: hypothetical protein BWX72_00138 [Firmicutes bacterium ADurb.Bin080]|nr:MAG: hypothetical protein BWX72_00138 [Firmicutes bacterium ADurb.Bin080]